MLEKLPLFLLLFAGAVTSFLFGISVGHYQFFPFSELQEAKKTLQEIVREVRKEPYYGDFLEFSDTTIENLNTARVRSFTNDLRGKENFLIFGGLNQYLDLCPEHGCLAVEVEPSGTVVRAYPYLPQEIYSASVTEGYPYEYIEFDPLQDTRPIGIDRFPNGDLLVVFQISHDAGVFPFGTGVARVDREGRPRWFRFDYSHHWPSPMRGDELLVLGWEIGDAPIAFEWPNGERHTLSCPSNRPYRGAIRFLDGDGRLLREISVLEAVLNSPFSTVLEQTTNGCDPLHLNFVDVVRDDLPAGIEGIEPGDLVVSLRNISAFGIIDPQSGNLKRLVHGTFIQQHSVQHLSGSKFLMFDNHGGSHEGGPSRLLEVDLATGTERTVFPTAVHSDDKYDIFSLESGHLSISPDRTRVIVNSTEQGTAFEVRISTGEVLREFVSLHDVSRIDGLAEERHKRAAIFQFHGIVYVPR